MPSIVTWRCIEPGRWCFKRRGCKKPTMAQNTVAQLTLYGSLLFAGIYLVSVLYNRAPNDFRETFPISVDPLSPQVLVIVLLVMSALFAATIVLRAEEPA